jgi:hypothetical protein
MVALIFDQELVVSIAQPAFVQGLEDDILP